MTFERLWAIWALATVVPLVLLHLRFRKRRKVEVTSLLLWRPLVTTRAGRTGLRRLRDRLALALLVAALLAFTGALAAPVSGEAPDPPRRRVIVLDGSVTMNAVAEGGSTRFEQAVAYTEQVLLASGPADEVCVWLADGGSHVLVPPTLRHDRAAEGLSRAQPTLARGSLPATLERVAKAAALRPEPPIDLLILTDEIGAAVLATRAATRASGASVDLPWEEHVGVIPSAAVGNAALTAEPVGGDPSRLTVRVRMTDGPRFERTLLVARGEQVLVREPVLLDGDGVATMTVAVPSASVDDVLTLRLEPTDAFAADDAVRRELRARPSLHIGAYTAGRKPSPFLLEALRALSPLVDTGGAVLLPADAQPSTFAGLDALIVQGDLPEALPADVPYVRFDDASTAAVTHPLLWSTGPHTLLQGVDLAPLRIDRAVVLPERIDATPVINSAAGPLALAVETSRRRAVVFGFPPEASTLPLEAAFPLLLRNALVWLSRTDLLPPAANAGEPLVPLEPLPDGITSVVVRGPGRRRTEAQVTADGNLVFQVPEPRPSGPFRLDILGLSRPATTLVNWTPPPGFRITAEEGRRPDGATDPATAAAALGDRTENVDTRRRRTPAFALAGVLLLLVGAVLLRRGG